MSHSTTSRTPGCTTLMATSRPSSTLLPLYTCAMQPEPSTLSDDISITWRQSAPKVASNTATVWAMACGVHSSCKARNRDVMATGNKSFRVAAHWQSLMYVGPAAETIRNARAHQASSSSGNGCRVTSRTPANKDPVATTGAVSSASRAARSASRHRSRRMAYHRLQHVICLSSSARMRRCRSSASMATMDVSKSARAAAHCVYCRCVAKAQTGAMAKATRRAVHIRRGPAAERPPTRRRSVTPFFIGPRSPKKDHVGSTIV
mmetsp:Transcript_11157/g.39283  ORF Transcript_11157/g.39283 Transcript_11157/m.39283 type:complete len:262 (-) Transcript_11157:812-1597(-)